VIAQTARRISGGPSSFRAIIDRMKAAIACTVLAFVVSCSGVESLKASGERCVASSECEAGLLCDLSQTPPVCAGSGSTPQVFDAQVFDGHPLIDGGGVVHVDAAKLDAPADGSGSGSGA